MQWNRLISRLPSGTGAGIGFSCLILLGVILLCERRANDTFPGAAALLLGAGGLLWQGRRWRELWIAGRLEKQRAERRMVHQKARQARLEIERQDAARKKQEALYAKQRAKEAADVRRLELRQQEKIQAAQRETRLQALAQETVRLQSLSERDLRDAIVSIFDRQGLLPLPIQDEAQCDILLKDVDAGSPSVARLVPRDRKAEAADVRALEAWRNQERASRAYLIALAGFSASAVREAARLPLTLVEAHLLAHWSLREERSQHDA